MPRLGAMPGGNGLGRAKNRAPRGKAMKKKWTGLRRRLRALLQEYDVIYQQNKPYLNMDDPEMRAWVEANDPQGMHQIEFELALSDIIGSHWCRMCMHGTERFLIIDGEQIDELVEHLIAEIWGLDPSTVMRVPPLAVMKAALADSSTEFEQMDDESLTRHAKTMLEDLKQEHRWSKIEKDAAQGAKRCAICGNEYRDEPCDCQALKLSRRPHHESTKS